MIILKLSNEIRCIYCLLYSRIDDFISELRDSRVLPKISICFAARHQSCLAVLPIYCALNAHVNLYITEDHMSLCKDSLCLKKKHMVTLLDNTNFKLTCGYISDITLFKTFFIFFICNHSKGILYK